jgi:hypothetical protein
MKSEVMGRNDQDCLDLVVEVDRRLARLFDEWDELARDGTHSDAEIVRRAWRRGTVGKLVHQHAAVRLAATTDIIRCLRRAGGALLAAELVEVSEEVREVLDRLDRHSRGRSALDLRYSSGFECAIDDLRRLVPPGQESSTRCDAARIGQELGSARSRLRSARQVARHAPLHPARRWHWYHRIPPVVRLHSLYDLLRGFPTAESSVFADAGLAERVDDTG